MNQRKLEQKAEDKRKQQELDDAKKIAECINEKDVKFTVKTGEGGKVFGSITSKEIAEEIQKQYGVKIDKKKIQLKEAIKGIGAQKVVIKLHPSVSATVSVFVVGA